tara:strand:- start:118 stop:594 length:477 start_codon:yes stop_codon:yes gene_type:complete
MVHRIQNRNPGYSDFSNHGSAKSFNFSTAMSAPVTNGANALKLENEIINENDHVDSSSGIMSDNHTTSEELKVENIVEDSSISEYEQSFTEEALETINKKEESETSNGLENFGVDMEEETPDLFDSKEETTNETSLTEVDDTEEDDLEIPAFLRRQKN